MIRPLADRVLVRRHPSPDTDGLLVIPDKARERPRHAVVLAVGPGAYDEDGQRIPIPVSVGDEVLIDKWAGHVLGREGGEDLVMISHADLHAIVADGPPL